jgi:hypothetical protein
MLLVFAESKISRGGKRKAQTDIKLRSSEAAWEA